MNSNYSGTGRDYSRPVLKASQDFKWMVGEEDPAEKFLLARETAWALLHRIKQQPDQNLIKRVINFTENHGIDDIAELWSGSHPQSLPGVMWRIYLLREVITSSPDAVQQIYRAGLEQINTIDGVVAGAEEPVTPEGLKRLSDSILRGMFVGDFADALNRAAAAANIFAAGAAHLADRRESDDPEEASRFTKQALRFDELARGLQLAAKNWLRGTFE